MIDKEYQAFLSDMGMEDPNKKKDASKQDDEPYVPPTLGRSIMGKAPAPPLMLTNGSNAPGAASAHARAVSAGQTPGGFLQTMGKSIFGGKLTRLTSGYKSHSELEMEREKKRLEWENRPVPVEWQVERYESGVNRRQEEYIKELEAQAAEAKRRKAAAGSGIAECLAMAPPPPPPGSRPASSSSSSSSSASMLDLPCLVGNPMSGLKR